MEPNIRSMLDTLTIHWFTKCRIEITVNRMDIKEYIVRYSWLHAQCSALSSGAVLDHPANCGTTTVNFNLLDIISFTSEGHLFQHLFTDCKFDFLCVTEKW